MSDSTRYAFRQVDVFGAQPQRGNPVAVVHDADGLSDAQMANFARWTNLSETTFLLRPTDSSADYRLRIFTPGGELPFAGHPTLGSCHAWLEAGGVPQNPAEVIQECGVGQVRVRCENSQLSFAAPARLRTGPLEPELLDKLIAALSVPRDSVLAHQWVDNGPGWCALLLDSAARVLEVRPDFAALGESRLGLVGAYDDHCDADYELRAFVPGLGVPEDPVTGSLNASVAQWLIGADIAPPNYVAAQGTAVGRSGRVHLCSSDNALWVGGATRSCIVGEVAFEG